MTYNIGPFQILYAYHVDPLSSDYEYTHVFLYDVLSSAYIGIHPDNEEFWDEYINSGVTTYPPKPSNYHDMDTVNWVWFLNQTKFTPYFYEQMKEYRDQKTAIEIVYDNGVTEFTAINNPETALALTRLCAWMPIANDNLGIIPWRNADGSYHDASYSDLQNLFYKCVAREEYCRKAESVIITNHQNTPYTDYTLAIPKADFDTEIGE